MLYLPLCLVVALLIAPHPSVVIVIINHHLNTLRNPRLAFLHLAIIYTLTFLTFSSLILCVVRDPGSISNSEHLADHDEDTELELSEALLAEDRKPRWCKKCMAPKPERAHHCSTCGRCILKMDHHCPWLASKCIGHRTYPAFVHFILGITLQAIYIGSISAQAIWYSFEHPFQVDTYTPVHELCLALAGIIFTLVMGSFFLYHVYLILTNQTTLENISPFFLLRHLPELRFPHGDQVRTLSDPPKEHELSYKQRALVKRAHGSLRMYDMGWRRNVAQVFGTGGHYGWVRRLWYGGSSPGDGRQFPRHPRTEQVLGKLAHELVQAEMSRRR